MVELMVSVTVFLIIASLVFSVTGTGRVSWYISSAEIFLYSQARGALSTLSRELMLSNSSRAFVEDAGTTLRFSIPLVDGSGDLMMTPGGDLRWGDGSVEGNSIKYTLSGTDLMRQIVDAGGGTVSESAVAHDVTNFDVAFLDPQYDFTIDFSLNNYMGKQFPGTLTYTVSTSITPQN